MHRLVLHVLWCSGLYAYILHTLVLLTRHGARMLETKEQDFPASFQNVIQTHEDCGICCIRYTAVVRVFFLLSSLSWFLKFCAILLLTVPSISPVQLHPLVFTNLNTVHGHQCCVYTITLILKGSFWHDGTCTPVQYILCYI